jgi:uncharacterized protein
VTVAGGGRVFPPAHPGDNGAFKRWRNGISDRKVTRHIPPFSLLIKPAGADCNLHCGYCFYLAKGGLYPETRRPRMSLETLEEVFRQFFAVPMGQYSFGWQGGEPTLMGVDFFREALAMQRRMAPPGAVVSNGLQTNGTLLTAEWAQLLRENNVLVGLSIDGPAEIHDRYRRWADRDGAPVAGAAGGTHRRVEETARLLREEKVSCNALTVVGRHNEDRPVEVYDYLRSLRIRHMQFIPLMEWERAAAGPEPSQFSVSAAGWGRFLNGIFDRWFPRDVRRVSIRHHDSIMELLVNGRYNVCTMSDRCGGHIVVEHNGDLYPCDFYVEPDLLLGSIHERDDETGSTALGRAVISPTYRAFIEQKARRDARCEECRYRRLCGGDCPKLRVPMDDGRGRSALCDGWISFYDHALADLERLSRSVAEEIGGPGAVPAVSVAAEVAASVPPGGSLSTPE